VRQTWETRVRIGTEFMPADRPKSRAEAGVRAPIVTRLGSGRKPARTEAP